MPEERSLAEEAHKRGLWEEAIRHYRKALLEDVHDSRLPLALGQCYEALAERKDTAAFSLLALEQYREAIRREPRWTAAYDALWAAASRAGRTEELIDDFKMRLRADPANEVLRGAFRRMEALYQIKTIPPRNVRPPISRAAWWFLEVLLPFCAVAMLCAGVVFAWRERTGGTGGPFAPVFVRAGAVVGVAYVIYKMFLGSSRKSR